LGIFPDTIKMAKVRLLHKKGDRQEIRYYRPISILSFLLKNFGKADLKKVNTFCIKTQYID
jgi:hypothetical protein